MPLGPRGSTSSQGDPRRGVTRLRFSIMLLTVFSGCATAPPSANDCGQQPTPADVDASVQAYIKGVNWKDPDSVQVRNVLMQPCKRMWKGLINGGGYETGWEIDFEVNAKNSYGGYTGFELKSIVRTPDGIIHWDNAE